MTLMTLLRYISPLKKTVQRLIAGLAVAGLLTVTVFDQVIHASHAGPHIVDAAMSDRLAGEGDQAALGGGCHGDTDHHSRHPASPAPDSDHTPDGSCTCCAAAHCLVFLAPDANSMDMAWTLAGKGDAKSVYAAPTPMWRLDRPPKTRT